MKDDAKGGCYYTHLLFVYVDQLMRYIIFYLFMINNN